MAKRAKKDGSDVPMGKPKGKPGRPKGAKAKANGIGHNSTGVTEAQLEDAKRESFLQSRTQWNQWKAKRAVVDKLEREVKAQIKADGHTVKQMKIADELAGNAKQEAKVYGEVSDRLRVARYIGHPMGAQFDLFAQPDRTPAVDVAKDQGKQASMENEPKKPPYDPSTPQYAAWMAGYDEHQKTLMSKFKPTAPVQPAQGWGGDPAEADDDM